MTTYLAYVDEAGDDGFPKYSSPLFVLASCYLATIEWRRTFERLIEFRRELKRQFALPVKIELHARQFLLNKNPYRDLGLSDAQRIEVISQFCDFLATLPLRAITVGIVKPRIRRIDYDVLDWAVKLAVQRVENDLRRRGADSYRFLIVSDEGRVGKMTRTTRRLQRFNPIQSQYGADYRREIELMVEDPLPKRSSESFFIQVADLLALIVHLHLTRDIPVGTLHGRLPAAADASCVIGWLTRLKPILNLQANPGHPFGIKIHPAA